MVITIINTLLFLCFCSIGLYYLFSGVILFKNPLLKNRNYYATGPQAFLIFTLATGMFMLGEYSAIRLFVWITYLCIGLFVVNGKIKYTFVSICYVLYIVYLFISLIFWAPSNEFGLRVIAKYIFPLFVMLFASKVGDSEFVTLSGIKWMIVFALIAEVTILLQMNFGIFWAHSTMADHLVNLVLMALALYFATKKKSYLWLLPCFFAFPILAVIRTGLLGITAGLSVFSLMKYKWKATPVIFGVIIFTVLLVLYVPSVRDKMFRKQLSAQEIIDNRDNLTMKDIDTNGRQAMWNWSLSKYYENNKLFGAGVGNLQKVFYSGDHPFGTIKIVHNDYIQILCDTGLVGLVLYLLIGLGVVIHSFYIYNNSHNNQMIKLCAIIAGSSVIGIMVTSYTDNSVNYTFATYCYPFAFYGMTLGLLRKYGR